MAWKNMIENDHGESLLALDELLKLTGLNRNLLHAWERRYGLMPDRRNAAGRRFYSPEQAERLRRLKKAVDAGHRIGAIADLSIEALAALSHGSDPQEPLKEIIDSALLLDSQRIAGLLRVRLRNQGLRPWLLETVVPLLRQVGMMWSEARLPVASEHILSVALRQVLLTCLLDQTVPEGARKAVVTTLEGESHEFGALTAALLARLEGIDAVYMGPTLPIRDIAASASRLKADVVMVSIIMMTPEAFARPLADLRAQLPADILMIVGGRNLHGLAPAANLIVQPDLEGLPALLRTL